LPSSENSLETSPYFLGGYIVYIQNPSNLTEKSCGIYVLLIAEEDSSINIGIKVLNEISKIKLNKPNYGVANSNTSYCYIFDYQNNLQNDTLILLTNLYRITQTQIIIPSNTILMKILVLSWIIHNWCNQLLLMIVIVACCIFASRLTSQHLFPLFPIIKANQTKFNCTIGS
jgi:hypothetical protein